MNIAALQSALQGIKLKPAQDVRDRSTPMTASNPDMENVNIYAERVAECNIDEWIDALGPETFKTELVPMTRTEVKSLLQHCRIVSGPFDRELEEKLNALLPSLSTPESETLALSYATVKSNLQACVDRLDPHNHGTFIKCSSRSAKDASLYAESLRKLYKQWYKTLLYRLANNMPGAFDADGASSSSSSSSPVDAIPESQFKEWRQTCAKDAAVESRLRLWAVLQAATEALKVHSADEALAMMACSERIRSDLILYLEGTASSVDESGFKFSLAVRQWQPNIAIDLEFRCFCAQNQMCALTQYNHILFFPHLVAMKDDILKAIQDAHETRVKPRLTGLFKNDTYVVDFALSADLKQVHAIEVNPQMSSDCCLFSRADDQDILLGKRPFEFRIVEREVNTKATVSNEWRDLLQSDPLELAA